jgi:23S rRNA pseudouridine1911/1915/1917 synthase
LQQAYPPRGATGGRQSARPGLRPVAGTDRKQPRFVAPGFHFVHRLDMETSGCLVIAKNEATHAALGRAFSAHAVHKEYLALVAGTVRWDELRVTKPIRYIRAGDPEWRVPRASSLGHAKAVRVMPGQKKGIALEEGAAAGKPCETHFKVLARYRGYTLLCATPKTGRTHQIRVHLQSIGHPLVYDPLYGRATALRAREFGVQSGSDYGDKVVLSRLPLHAWKLSFAHPATGETISVTAPLPRDLRELFKLVRRTSGANQLPRQSRDADASPYLI